MKKPVGIIAILGLMGCQASAPKTQSVVSTVPVEVYTRGLQSVDAKQAKRDGSCPSRVKKSSKDLAWRDLLDQLNACVAKSRYGTAQQLNELLTRREPFSPWSVYYKSLFAEHANQYPRAMWMINLAIKRSPKTGLFYFQRGRLNHLAKNVPAATEDFEKAVDRDPSLVSSYLYLAQVHARDLSYKKAAGYLADFKKYGGEFDRDTHLLAAKVHFGAGAFEKSADSYRQVVRSDSKNHDARLALARILDEKFNQAEEALEHYKILERNGGRGPSSVDPKKISEKVKDLEKKIETQAKKLAVKKSEEAVSQ